MLQAHHGGSRESGQDAANPTREPRKSSEATLRFGRCEVRPASRDLLVDGRHRHIQPLPFDLLLYLIVHRERVLTIDALLDAIWGGQIVRPGSITVAINRIRSVLPDAGRHIIRTYHRVGYRFVAELEDGDENTTLSRHGEEG